MADQVTRNIIVKASAEDAFKAWENYDNFPLFMKNIKEVHKTGERMSHWVVAGPLGKDVEWTAETTTYEPNKRLGWSTKDREGDVTTSGQVTFNALPNNETEVTVMMQYLPKGGKAGEAVANVLAKPDQMVEEALSSFKSYVEGMQPRGMR